MKYQYIRASGKTIEICDTYNLRHRLCKIENPIKFAGPLAHGRVRCWAFDPFINQPPPLYPLPQGPPGPPEEGGKVGPPLSQPIL